MRLNRDVPASEVAQQLDQSIAGADTHRADELDQLRIIREARAGGMEREAARLSAKLGPDDPRVAALTNAIEINREVVSNLTIEVERARTPVTGDENSWILHGYVRDQNLKGVAGLTVAPYDEKTVWVEQLGFACTDDKGYFRLSARDIAGLNRSVFVRVLNSGAFLYADTSELKPELGRVDYREITLSADVRVCTPPGDVSAPPIKPPDIVPIKPPDVPPAKPPDVAPTVDPGAPPDAWVVRGRVIDESGKGLAGLTVSVFDKDLIFDDRLGDTKTGADGSFGVTYRTEDFRDLIERKPDIYLKVLDQKGKTLYTSEDSIRYEAGRVEVFEIKIAAGKLKQ
jgi:hypothetical protein